METNVELPTSADSTFMLFRVTMFQASVELDRLVFDSTGNAYAKCTCEYFQHASGICVMIQG